MGAVVNFQPSQVALIRRTVAKDCNDTEFNLFVEMCRARGLNPLLRHAFAQVYNKDPKKDKDGNLKPGQKERQLVIVVSREGQRALAERTKAYRPDDRAPRFDQDDSLKDPRTNPAGLISAEVSVYKHSHGEWFPVTEVAYWEEYAPLKEVWEGKGDDARPSGVFEIQKGKDGWRKMPRIMLAKCAEMAALRKAFPDDFAGLYGEEEMDRGEVVDLTPSEWAEKADQDHRLQLVGAHAGVLIDWLDDKPLERVADGKFYDATMAFLRTCDGNPKRAKAWIDRNRHAFNEFWARHKGEALELKKAIEAAESQPAAPDPQLDLIECILASNGVA